ncbi:tRNA glutamyl-Q(34) synthetase GluQRS [Derxia gummosa]|uniref:Glutamyl-Q tRNA(Asp) synthetase n=1 Tax=Derxia gummosa DSM 723 TaxID=1121388 RepID=A0A8B6X7P0_9BURK|nr:tRNA glutamyl-Q(34) synthetase GluQRS [Derxia gummosa]
MSGGHVGRFAPSPTGPLHAGSMVAALASRADVLAHGGRWLLRIEDVDGPRAAPGATDAILQALAACGFAHDGEIVFQSRRGAAYAAALDGLIARDLAYPCACTRAEVAREAARRTADGEAVYSGACAHGIAPERAGARAARAWRARMPDRDIAWTDRWRGPQHENPARDTGDVVVKRADGIWAYHLAVVVDDIAAGVTDIVRGADLLHSTARQIALREALGVTAPLRWLHVPLLRDAAGNKLSKQTLAPAVDVRAPLAVLTTAARALGLDLAGEPRTVAAFWTLAPAAWERRLAALPE